MQYGGIAVVGISGRFAKCKSLKDFHEMLKNAVDCIEDMPDERKKLMNLSIDKKYMQAGYLADIDKFDCDFFGISTQEANYIAPEQKIALELAALSILNAGYSLKNFRGTNCSVFVSSSDINDGVGNSLPNSLAVLGQLKAMISGRIAYCLDLRGANVMYDSGCSSSLNSIHEACIKLMTHENDYALVGAVSLFTNIEEDKKHKYETLGIMSPDYRSKSFDTSADGTSAGEGAGFLLLKRLEDAQKENDYIWGVIKAGCINSDGGRCSKVSIPSAQAQYEVIRDAWKDVEIQNLTEIEAHGIGNKIGDSVEAESIVKNVIENKLSSKEILLSSVKTNVGHLYEAAGITGVIKVLLGYYYREAYQMVHFTKENELVNFSKVNLQPVRKLIKYPKDAKRMTGIDAFGISGTNVHIVLENYIRNDEREPECPQFVKVSAKTEKAFNKLCDAYGEYFDYKCTDYHAAVFTMNTGRDDYACRRMFYCENQQDLAEKITALRASTKFVKKKVIYVLKQENYTEYNFNKYCSLYPGMEKWKKQISDTNDWNFKYELYQYLQACEVRADIVLADKTSRALIEYVNGQRCLEELLSINQPVDNNCEKIVEQVRKNAKNQEIQLVVFGNASSIKKSLTNEKVKVYELNHEREMGRFFCEYYNNGNDINWSAFYGNKKCLKVPMPEYCYERESHWIKPKKNVAFVLEKKELPETKTVPHVDTNELWVIKKFVEELWRKLLNFSDKIGYEEDFFYLGGNSLLVEMMADPINEQYGIDFDIYQIYDNETVEKFAQCIRESIGQEK